MLNKILPLTKNKLIVLEELYKHKELNLSSISKNTNKVQPLILRTLKELNEILNIKKLGNIKLYSIKTEYITTLKPIIERIRLENAFGINTQIFNLIKNTTNIKKIFVFGSYAKNNQTKKSDIDLFIISNDDKDKIKNEISKISKLTNLNIEPIIYNLDEYENLKTNKNSNFHHILFTHIYERIEIF